MSWHNVRRQLKGLIATILLAVIATGVSYYILRNERLRMPWDDLYTISAEFSTGQAMTPGQGQSVTVAGVKVGEIAKVSLSDGNALVDLQIERDKLPRVYKDATILVRPRTALQDLTLDVDPGTADAGRVTGKDVIGLESTTPSTNLDEVLASLDRDTRDYATALVGGLGAGVKDRGEALRDAFKASAPTLRLQRKVAAAVGARRQALSRAITSLHTLTRAVASDDDQVGRLVRAADTTFTAVADEDDALRNGLERLPGTLDAAEEALNETAPFARAAAPAFNALVPAARELVPTLAKIDPLVTEGLPALRNLNALSREARPLSRSLSTAASRLTDVTPELTEAFKDLRYLTNVLAYNDPGADEGYLYRMAWYLHNQNSFLSGQDGNGPFWRGQVIISCTTGLNNPILVGILGPVLEQLEICPQSPGP